MIVPKAASLLAFFLLSPSLALPIDERSESASTTDPYVQQINKYRAEMNPKRGPMTYNATLYNNDLRTLKDHPGQLVHELWPGTFAQVLAGGPCTMDGFVTALVKGWICEKPELLPKGSCDNNPYNSGGQTGHAEILSSTKYTKAGCACYQNVWGCDFA